MEQKDMRKFFIIQYIIIALLILVVIFLIIDKKDTNNGEVQENINETIKSDYDVSMMNEVDIEDAISMFDSGEKYVLYIGRETCGVCKSILPKLQTAQNDFDYITQYMDITKIDRNGNDWNKLEKLLNIETTMNVTNSDGEKELLTETYGYFVGNYGYTPTLILIDNKKMVAGHIGNFSYDDLESWLRTNGII